MKNFGKLLRTYIERSGYTNYGIAQKANVNRTTLQKILANERIPSQEFMDRIFPLLKLTPEESCELLSVFEIMQTGESLFAQRRSIKQMLESISDITRSLTVNTAADAHSSMQSSPDISLTEEIHYGRYEVGILLTDLITRECAGPSPTVRISLPANIGFFKQIFLQTIRYCPNKENLTIQHLTCFLKADTDNISPAPNLDILANILPFLASPIFNYEVYYYYDNYLISDAGRTAFPYYVLFSDTVVLLSADGNTAIPFQKTDMLFYFNNLFEAALQNSNPFITSCPHPEDVLPHLIGMDMDNRPFYSLEFQPCITAYLTERMLRTYANPDIENYETALELTTIRINQLKNMDQHVSIFSKAGLLHFSETGLISDFPSGYMIPLSVRDRITILEALYQDIYTGKHNHRLVNPLIFPISQHLICHLHQDAGLDFSSYELSGNSYHYIHIEERTLLEAFGDFFQYMINSPLVYSKEDTLTAIRTFIENLKNI